MQAGLARGTGPASTDAARRTVVGQDRVASDAGGSAGSACGHRALVAVCAVTAAGTGCRIAYTKASEAPLSGDARALPSAGARSCGGAAVRSRAVACHAGPAARTARGRRRRVARHPAAAAVGAVAAGACAGRAAVGRRAGCTGLTGAAARARRVARFARSAAAASAGARRGVARTRPGYAVLARLARRARAAARSRGAVAAVVGPAREARRARTVGATPDRRVADVRREVAGPQEQAVKEKAKREVCQASKGDSHVLQARGYAGWEPRSPAFVRDLTNPSREHAGHPRRGVERLGSGGHDGTRRAACRFVADTGNLRRPGWRRRRDGCMARR